MPSLHSHPRLQQQQRRWRRPNRQPELHCAAGGPRQPVDPCRDWPPAAPPSRISTTRWRWGPSCGPAAAPAACRATTLQSPSNVSWMPDWGTVCLQCVCVSLRCTVLQYEHCRQRLLVEMGRWDGSRLWAQRQQEWALKCMQPAGRMQRQKRGQRPACAPPHHCEDFLASRRYCTGGISCCCGGDSGCAASSASESAAGSRPRLQNCASTSAACSLRYCSSITSCRHNRHETGRQPSGRRQEGKGANSALLASHSRQQSAVAHNLRATAVLNSASPRNRVKPSPPYHQCDHPPARPTTCPPTHLVHQQRARCTWLQLENGH
jgi:hypothetical protein